MIHTPDPKLGSRRIDVSDHESPSSFDTKVRVEVEKIEVQKTH